MTSISLRSILILTFHLLLGFPKGLLSVNLPVKILKDLPILDLIILTILDEGFTVKLSPLPILIQIFASGSYSHLILAFFPLLTQ